jgi:putative membrane protein
MKLVVLAQMMGRGDHMDNGNGWWWVMGIIGLLILIAVVVIVVMVLQRSNAPRHEASASTRRTADDLLSERFARGEIDEDEYRRRREALRE